MSMEVDVDDSGKDWVHSLKLSHKETILDPRGWICSDVMNQFLQIADQFPHINGLQMTKLVPIFDTKSYSWKCNKRFQLILPPSLQINHTGRYHWVLSLESRNNEVCILDSLSIIKNHTVNTPSLEIQMSQIYKKDKTSIPIKILDIQQQENGNDCGLFAIANLVEFCYKEIFF